MSTFTVIPDTDLDANSPITENIMLALRDNPLAIQQGDASAPRIQKEALGPESVGSYLINTSQDTTKGTLSATQTGSLTTVYTNVTVTGLISYALGGAFQDAVASTVGIQLLANGSWRTIYSVYTGSSSGVNNGGLLLSNGSNVRIFVTPSAVNKQGTCYFYYNKQDI